MKRIFTRWLPGLIFLVSTAAHSQTDVPHDFVAGQPARAAEVNENFQTLEDSVNQNSGEIAANTTGIATNAGSIQDNQAAIAALQSVGQVSAAAAQIQTGLDLTSGLRWLVAFFYEDAGGNFPSDNASAGAGASTDWSNRFVSDASITTDGIIIIIFQPDAAPEIANQAIYLTPTASAAGVVWFDCSGDGVTDQFVAELGCAFSDPPYMPLYVPRQQIETAFDLLEQSDAIQLVQNYTNTFDIFPADNVTAGLVEPTGYRNKYVSSLEVVAGMIRITFGHDARYFLNGTALDMSPITHSGSIEWTCRSNEIADRYLPARCR